MLGRPGFELDDVEQVRAACLGGRDIQNLLSNKINVQVGGVEGQKQGIQRIADVPIYFTDPLVRRSAPLQKTRDARLTRGPADSTIILNIHPANNRLSAGRAGRSYLRRLAV